MNYSASAYVEYVNKIRPFGWIAMEYPKAYKFEQLDPFYWHPFAIRNRNVVFYIGALYVAIIFGLQRWMKDRPAYKLKMPLFLWNLALGIFSVVGFVRLTPGLFLVLSSQGGFYKSLCTKVADVPSSFWGLMFIFSKYFELGDTIFIVLRKRPLNVLHWYHHVITLIMVWVLAPHGEPVARWFGWLNYGVHSFMYNYFALKAIGVKIPNYIANFITTLQLSQMLVGFFANAVTTYYYSAGQNCHRHPDSIKLFAFVCGSFILLFGKLFYDKVVRKRGAIKEKVTKAE